MTSQLKCVLFDVVAFPTWLSATTVLRDVLQQVSVKWEIANIYRACGSWHLDSGYQGPFYRRATLTRVVSAERLTSDPRLFFRVWRGWTVWEGRIVFQKRNVGFFASFWRFLGTCAVSVRVKTETKFCSTIASRVATLETRWFTSFDRPLHPFVIMLRSVRSWDTSSDAKVDAIVFLKLSEWSETFSIIFVVLVYSSVMTSRTSWNSACTSLQCALLMTWKTTLISYSVNHVVDEKTFSPITLAASALQERVCMIALQQAWNQRVRKRRKKDFVLDPKNCNTYYDLLGREINCFAKLQ